MRVSEHVPAHLGHVVSVQDVFDALAVAVGGVHGEVEAVDLVKRIVYSGV
jgi:hypothetical protein